MLELLDYRRQVFEMYARIRALGTDQAEAYALWVNQRDVLFGAHTQSALDEQQRANFTGLRYYDYDPAYRIVAALDTAIEPVEFTIHLEDDGALHMTQIGQVKVNLPTGSGTLGVFWIEGYGGGIFIPFRDSTNTKTTYGAGRYLYDTIKGADLGTQDGALVLDFNYAYHPSCAYNPRWVCPLAPPTQALDFPVAAGEQLPGV